MSDLKALGMSDLIALYNTEAARTGKEPTTEFKTTKAAREAIEALRALPDAGAPFDGGTDVEASGKPVLIPAGDNSKYSSTDKRGPNQGVGAYAKELISQGLDNAAVLAAVAERFPTAKTSKGCIAYYRTALRNAAKKATEPQVDPVAEAPAEEPATV